MDPYDLRRLLDSVRAGTVSVDDAALRLRMPSTEETGGFATVDLQRGLRCGFPEVIFGQGKTGDQIAAILRTMSKHGLGGLATRVVREVGERLASEFPEGVYNPLARTFRIAGPEPDSGDRSGRRRGRVVIVTAGTSDLPVAEEARVTAEAWDCEVSLVVDVGVAGLHRLLSRLPDLAGADVVVVIAGMEGALPSVVGGLVDCPVIAVPTSIGYGASFGGVSALLGMLNSCASNVVVVNIDSGFNGGHVAGLIARRAGQARTDSEKVIADGLEANRDAEPPLTTAGR